jgi:hypothetical protein
MRRFPSIFTAILLFAGVGGAAIAPPADYFGHEIGADRTLVSYPRVLEYLRAVAAASPRVSMHAAGTSTLDNEMVVVALTSEDNQQRLGELRDASRRLANADRLTAAETAELVARSKVLALVTCTIHSTEVGCTQMATELVHEVATTDDPRKLAWLDDVVMLLMPSINPDGQVMIVDWYKRYLGTEYEGGPMPWLYHHYVGHDNNRDFYMLTQKESRVVNEILYHRWFPQVFLDEHQMGSTGPRMFVPPQTDPLAPEVSSLIFRQADLLGTNMSYRLEEAGKLGVGHNMIFDSYWPGGTRNTAWWKNVTGLLTEVASARIATPIYIEPGELEGGRKGLPDYTRRANFPSPWPGGWWRLRDIVDYELIATWAFVETLSQYRHEFLANFARMARDASDAGTSRPPYAWILPPDQHDPVAAGRLVELLLRHGVRVETTREPLRVGLTTYPAGTTVIRAAQPYRAFLLTMLRPQRYPEVRPHENGPVLPPYDVTSWSLPISMGVEIAESSVPPNGRLEPLTVAPWPRAAIEERAAGFIFPRAADTTPIAVNRLLAEKRKLFVLPAGGGRAAGDIFLPARALRAAELERLAAELHLPVRSVAEPPTGPALRMTPRRVGLYKPWVASMDEGWTRWLLEQYEFAPSTLANDDIKDGSFRRTVDVLILPDVSKHVIATGEPEPERQRFLRRLPPEYAGGIAPDGGEQIKEWVAEGGTLVAFDSSCDYVIDLFELPVRNVLAGRESAEVTAPGTALAILVDTEHPLGHGLRPREAAYFAKSPAFKTAVPDARFERRVVARYPDHRDDIPISGFIRGAEHLERLAAVVEFSIGRGKVVLFGFRPQHRAQTLRTFKLLFNAIYFGGLQPVEL